MKSGIFLSFAATNGSAQSKELLADGLGVFSRDVVWNDREIRTDDTGEAGEEWARRFIGAVEHVQWDLLWCSAVLRNLSADPVRVHMERECREIFPKCGGYTNETDSDNHLRHLAEAYEWTGGDASEGTRGVRASARWASQPVTREGDDMGLMLLTQSNKPRAPKLPPPGKLTKNKRKKKLEAFQENSQTGADLSPRKPTGTQPPSKPTPGKAARALKRMREEVKFRIPNQPLTLKQMASECGILGSDGKPSASSYQYIEESVRDKFDMDRVDQIKGPLIKRGISIEQIVRELVGETGLLVSPARNAVRSSPNDILGARRVPVVSRHDALRILRGDVDILELLKAPTAQRWDTRKEVVLGMVALSKLEAASDRTIAFDVLDGKGSQIAVDGEDRELVDGKSYVWTIDNEAMFFSVWSNGRMIMREGPENGRSVPFDPASYIVLGRVVRFIGIE